MKIVAAFDSFKGSLSSIEAGNAAREGIMRVFPEAEVIVRPLADGGEGTVDAMTYESDAERITLAATGPLGEPVEAVYAIDNGCAVMEMAAAAGITLVPAHKRDPMMTTTFGVGMLIKDAIQKGIRKFIIGIGGSATNDCGTGMLTALGFEFFTESGEKIRFGARDPGKVCRISSENVLPCLSECEFSIISDVKNPLCGENGCSYVFAAQKGASAEDIEKMDADIRHFAHICEKHFPSQDIPHSEYEGAGAAGGLGYAFIKFLNGNIISGSAPVINALRLSEYLDGADIFITGEGKLDGQTAMGKAPFTAAMCAKEKNIPVIAFGGCVGDDADILIKSGTVDAMFSIVRGACPLDEAMKRENAYKNLADTAENVFRVIKVEKPPQA